MNKDLLSKRLLTVAAAGALFAACSHAKPAPEEKAPQASTQPAAQPATAPTTAPVQASNGQDELDRAMEALRNVSVFFEFDSATLTSEAREKLSAVGNVLARYPDLKVRVEGNCDERGTEQYNLALGQRRADSAKRYLTDLGVKPNQLAAISFGAEKPRATGHDEAAWQQNRRADVATYKK
ncbi:MAG: peptidoglycan-associated lipoprotein Pal [Myxococcales bacterium]